MRASWIGAALSGVCAAFILTQQAKASSLLYSIIVSGTGTAMYSTSSDDPSFRPLKGSGAATFSADGENFFGMIADVSINIPGAGISTSAQGDNFNGPAVVTGISSNGIGSIHIEASNENTGFGSSSSFGKVTLRPTSITSQVEDGQLVYTIAGTGTGDAKVMAEEPNVDASQDPAFFTYETDVNLDISSFTGTVYVTSVPLPASGPMLGGALVLLGAAGIGLNRVWNATA